MKKPAKPWKPKTAAAQITAHHKSVAAARKAAAHPVATKAKAIKAAKATLAAARKPAKRKWSPDESVALCSARAVAESLRIALGVPVSHDDVLALYWLVADDADAGASILETLEAAQGMGAGSALPLSYRHWTTGPGLEPGDLFPPGTLRRGSATFPLPVILGLDLPFGEPHAVTVAPDGTWWSWGEPYSPADFAGAVIDEAWAVTWQ